MKYLSAVLVLLVAFSKEAIAKKHHRQHHHKSNDNKIVGGHDATIQDYPYQAFVLLKAGEDDYFGCGGAIISESYILSAAHCFKDVQSAKVRIGSTRKYSGGQQYSATFEVHPNYDDAKRDFDYDIAILKTNEEMALDGVNSKAVAIVDGDISIPSGSMVKLSGWGEKNGHRHDSPTLRAVELPTWSNEECSAIEDLTDRQFCAGYKEGGKDSCQGDSGGPAVLADSGLLAGLVSANYGCARPNTPGVYTNLTNLRDWIKEKTNI